jgi:RimJ/RimL family protein N-acetyltransferase
MALLASLLFALALTPGSARAKGDTSEFDLLRAQNEQMRDRMQSYDDALMALTDQNESLRLRVDGIQTSDVAQSAKIDVASAGITEGWDVGAHFMLRHKHFTFSKDERGVEAHNNSFAQYRALLTFNKTVTEAIDFTFQFGAGQGSTGRGFEQTLGAGGDDFANDGVFINQAYITWRPTVSDDLADLAAYLSNPDFLRYLAAGFPGAEEFLANNEDLDWSQACGFAMDEAGTVVGSVHLQCERPNMVAELACLISPSHWGKGIAREACEPVIEHGFRELGIEKIYARADSRNAGSIGTMVKLAMKLEGRLRGHQVDREGRRVDEVAYGLLRSEWSRSVE